MSGQTQEEFEKELSNLLKSKPNLRVISGGKGPPKASGDNWLRDLPQKTVFLCKRKTEAVDVYLWFIVFKFEKAILLGSNVNQELKVIVDDVEFCKRNELLEIIELGDPVVPDKDKNKKSKLILPE